jgi:hypothetical protein
MSALMRMFERLFDEIKHHADPTQHKPIDIARVESRFHRIGLASIGIIGFLMIPVAAILPVLPIWPFALIMLVAFARTSSRFCAWLTNNRVFNTAFSIIRNRPERAFRIAHRWLNKLLGVA